MHLKEAREVKEKEKGRVNLCMIVRLLNLPCHEFAFSRLESAALHREKSSFGRRSFVILIRR